MHTVQLTLSLEPKPGLQLQYACDSDAMGDFSLAPHGVQDDAVPSENVFSGHAWQTLLPLVA